MLRVWVYVGSGRACGVEAARTLARLRAVWVPGSRLPKGPSPVPGDVLLLFWRPRREDRTALFLGCGVIARPANPWGGTAWLDTVAGTDPLCRRMRELGYSGPPNYMTTARLTAWAEDIGAVRDLLQPVPPGLRLEPGREYGVPPDGFLFPAAEASLTPAPVHERSLMDRITVEPDVLGGKPVLRGLRIAVEHVLGWIASGATTEEILADVPELEREDIQACLEYARRLVGNERIDPAAGAA
jgi:uncharacterized protein (DUF433 family)